MRFIPDEFGAHFLEPARAEKEGFQYQRPGF
jgi:hypothetical protein